MKATRFSRTAGLICLLVVFALMLQGCGPKTEKKEEAQSQGTSGTQAPDGGKEAGANTEEPEKAEEPKEEEPQEGAPTAEPTDTIRWFNASYAILTELNNLDYTMFAGAPATETMKEMELRSLEEWWGVTDRQSADETLEWALSEGHRTDFKDYIQTLQDVGIADVAEEERAAYLTENYQLTETEAQFSVDTYKMYEQYGENAIDGWDYCRALNLLSFYYLAGFYTEQEALDKSLEVAQTVQPLFTSWDELVDSYLRGYEYWAEESSEERRGVYEDLKGREDNPYAVDYQTTLEKTW